MHMGFKDCSLPSLSEISKEVLVFPPGNTY